MLTRRRLLQLISLVPLLSGYATRSCVPCTLLLSTRVAGYRHYDGSRIESTLREGQSLVLRREPANAYDVRAVAVYNSTGRKLGYIPRRENEIPSRLMDQGVELEAVIVRFDRNAVPWQRVRLEVRMT